MGQIDCAAIADRGVAGLFLMERAGEASVNILLDSTYEFDVARPVVICGGGNNGGDGLVIARLLAEKGLNVNVYFVKFSDKVSDDFDANFKRLQKIKDVKINILDDINNFPSFRKNEIIIDAIFGSGLTRPLKGLPEEVVKKINESGNDVVAIDSPSGLFGEDNPSGERTLIRATHTLSFQYPSLSFMFAENDIYVGEFHIIDIGIHKDFIQNTETYYYYTIKEDIKIFCRDYWNK